jgi:PAS domain S-box-containing protein
MPKKDNPLDKPRPGVSANEFPELNEFCELLVKNSPNGIIVADESSTIVFVNDAYCRMTGRSRDDYIGARPPYSDWPLDESKMVEGYLRRTSEGEFEPWETTLVSEDGESLPVLVSSKEIRTKTDTVYYYAMVCDITEQERVEAQLRDGEEKFRRIAETSTDVIYLIDVDGFFTYVSPAIKEILGYKPEEFAGTHFGSHFRPEDLPVAEQTFRKNMSGEEIRNVRMRILSKNGTPVPIEVNGMPVSEGDRVVGVQGVGRDVTEHERFETALRRSEARFKAQYKGLPIPIYTWQKVDDDFVLIDFNRAAEEITDGGIVDYRGVKATELFHDSPDLIDDMHLCYSEKGDLQRELLHSFKTTKKTRQLFVSLSYVPPDLLLVHTQDVTARAEAEQRLRESEARFRTAVDSLPFDFFMLDNNGRYVMTNDALKSHWPDDIIGLRPRDLQVDEGTKTVWEENNRRAFAGEVVQGEVSFEMGGEKRVFHNIISPVYDGDEVRGVLGVNIDVTDRKRSEEALEMSRQQLRALAGRLHDVREEQSTNIAREIHDELGQALTGLRWELSWVEKRIGKAKNADEKKQL